MSTTIIVFLIIISVLVNNNSSTYLVVNAQQPLFVDCEVYFEGIVAYQYCRYNTPSPVTLDLSNGQLLSLGTESSIYASCVGGIPSKVTCTCNVVVNSELCNSCNIEEISFTKFVSYFDCSNLLIGDCVGIDVDGECIDNSNNVVNVTSSPTQYPSIYPITPTPSTLSLPVIPTTLSPTLVTTSSMPIPSVPVNTVMSPTMSPVMATSMKPVPIVTATTVPQQGPMNNNNNNSTDDLLTDLPKSERDQQDINKSTNSKIGIVISCTVGVLVLAGVIGMFVRKRHHRQQHMKEYHDHNSSSNKPSVVVVAVPTTTSNYQYDVELDADDDDDIRSFDDNNNNNDPTTPPMVVVNHYDPSPPRVAAIIQPPVPPSNLAKQDDRLYTITEVSSNFSKSTKEFSTATGHTNNYSQEASMVDNLVRNNTKPQQPTSQSSPSSQQSPYPIGDGFVVDTTTTEPFRSSKLDELPTPPLPTSLHPHVEDPNIPMNLIFGESTIMDISALSAPSEATTLLEEPSGILLTQDAVDDDDDNDEL